ncbi:UDP-glucose/GDP-mannose dehydrogenase family protein [Meiothermus sp.]|uniref:UDP-glucose dehydrogenase family protein n=1 Tax=Meiothermus sp. TaxID=1955249 RepID=UPI0021DCFEA0|nr:UDP-glucose/GDP-mannose dehydrogenase family protein [Meiothermus sp.]GIW26059.1 MAG: UDP-glucose 6-dehydrogenase [Meiothermus sp.]
MRAMKVTVIGTGYVGITTGVTLAYIGHEVTCVDIDPQKLALLRSGKAPIYEPGLEELMHLARERLKFTDAYAEAVPNAEVIFVAVGTPSDPEGNPDLRYVQAAAEGIGQHLSHNFTVIVNKSTVPIGSGNWVESLVRAAYEATHGKKARGHFAVASNPEFLREGSAIYDALYPDRIVVGTEQPEALEVLYNLYRPLLEQSFAEPAFQPRPATMKAVPLITADLASAELIKYAANAFLSVKISFINEIANLAERVGADITQIARGIGLDSRIGPRFLQAGVGWGGSCFGKDTAALVSTAREYGLTMPIVQAAREVNYRQRERMVEKLQRELKILKGRTIGLLGLTFKPNTDDLRDSPALDIAQRLIKHGVRVRVHDPIALQQARQQNPTLAVEYYESVMELAEDADALVLVTDWAVYRELDWEGIAKLMKKPLVVDGRNFLDKKRLAKAGFQHVGVGMGANPQLITAEE